MGSFLWYCDQAKGFREQFIRCTRFNRPKMDNKNFEKHSGSNYWFAIELCPMLLSAHWITGHFPPHQSVRREVAGFNLWRLACFCAVDAVRSVSLCLSRGLPIGFARAHHTSSSLASVSGCVCLSCTAGRADVSWCTLHHATCRPENTFEKLKKTNVSYRKSWPNCSE